jgi:hypothetical protein
MCRIWRLTALFGIIASLGAAAEEISPVVKTVEVHAGLPALEVRIVPTATYQEAGPPHTIGRIEISRPGELKPFQTIEVSGYNGPRNLPFSKFEDANFDGYTDLLLGNDGGAKWGGYAIYFYAPESGTFVENGLSREMSERLTGQELIFHFKTREIELTHLLFGCQDGLVSSDTFVIQGTRLRQTEEVKHVRTPEGCYAVRYLLQEDGSRAEVSRERVPDLDRDPG